MPCVFDESLEVIRDESLKSFAAASREVLEQAIEQFNKEQGTKLSLAATENTLDAFEEVKIALMSPTKFGFGRPKIRGTFVCAIREGEVWGHRHTARMVEYANNDGRYLKIWNDESKLLPALLDFMTEQRRVGRAPFATGFRLG